MRPLLFLVLLIVPVSLWAQLGVPHIIDTSVAENTRLKLVEDMDGDGDIDVLVGGVNRSLLLVNQGAGQFAPPAVLAHSQWTDCATKDINGDDIPDVIYLIVEDAERVAWRAGMGNGSFGEEQVLHSIASTFEYERYYLADLDQDGDQDMVCLVDTGLYEFSLQASFNDGSGLFSPAWELHFGFTTGLDLAIGDLDADNVPDIVYAIGSEYSLKYRPGGADGSVGAEQDLALQEVYELELMDLDLDGGMELVCNSDDGLRIYDWNGTGLFLVQQLPLSTRNTTNWVASDVDTDGDLDLILGASVGRKLIVLRNSGGWVFEEEVWLPLPQNTDGIGMADLDGNGWPDPLVSVRSQGRVIWRPNQEGALQEERVLAFRNNFPQIRLSDVNADGYGDIVVRENEDHLAMLWYPGMGGGNYGAAIHWPALAGGLSFEMVDISGDGVDDLIRADVDSIIWHANNGEGQFGTGQALIELGGDSVKTMLFGDYDLDGLQDFLLATVDGHLLIFRGEGGASFVPIQDLDLGRTVRELHMTDLSNDGLADLAMVVDADPEQDLQNQILVLWAVADWQFSAPVELPVTPSIFANSQLTIRIADMDSDGDQDIVHRQTVHYNNRPVRLHRNTGAGQFEQAVDLSTISFTHMFELSDIDRDGDTDLVRAAWVAPNNLNTCKVLINNGNGTMSDMATHYPLVVGTSYDPPAGTGSAAWVLKLADQDGDGADDLLVLQENGAIYWRRNYLAEICSVAGTVYRDLNEDGVKDADEPGVPWFNIDMTPQLYDVLTTTAGEYAAQVVPGEYQLECLVDDALWTVTNVPPVHTAIVTETDPIDGSNDFGIVPVVDTSIVAVDMTYAPSFCGVETSLWISCANLGTRTESGTLTFTLDPLFEFVSAVPEPTAISGSNFTWQVDGLAPYDVRTFRLVLQVPGVEHLGQQYGFTAGLATGNALFDDSLTGVVECAYDPNDKQVDPEGYGAFGAVDIGTQHLDYTIRFQNTGTATAQDVVIRDPLPMGLERGSIRLLGCSHMPSSLTVGPTDELVIRFDGIMLADSGADLIASQGFVNVRFYLIEGLPHLTTIRNTAAIHFDLNPPIITNTTLTTLVDCDLWDVTITSTTPDVLMASSGSTYQWSMNGELLPEDTLQTLLVGSDGDYSVAVTSAYGCVATAEFQVIGTGIDDRTSAHVAVVPNPFGQEARLIVSEVLTAQHVIELIDVHGRTVQAFAGTGTREVILDRSGMASGLYLVRILKDEQLLGMVRVVVE